MTDFKEFMYEIQLSETYNSSMILFSIPVHERQDIIHNQIENILFYNPNAKIILHINPSFTSFQREDIFSKYKPYIFVNTNQYDYKHGKGLMWIHVQNFFSAVEQNIEFDTYVLISSNEMFFQKGLIKYIKSVKNGVQLVPYHPSNSWHNFHKGLEFNPQMSELIKKIGLPLFYGGQAEGNFFEKPVFEDISKIYLSVFGNQILYDFETEEVVPQTIFASLHKPFGNPFTLQNYTNKIKFDYSFIMNLRDKSFIVPIKPIKGTLQSPHMGKSSESIFSVKRIDRDWVPIRYSLTFQDSWTMNRDLFIESSDYFSNQNLRLTVKDKKSFSLKIFSSSFSKKQGVQFLIDKGQYKCSCSIKSNVFSNHLFETVGWKLKKKKLLFNTTLFNEKYNSNKLEWQMIVDEPQNLVLYWSLNEPSFIDIENFSIEPISNNKNLYNNITNIEVSFKPTMCLCFHVFFGIKQQTLFLDWCKHISNYIIEPLQKMFHINIFFSVSTVDFCWKLEELFPSSFVFWVHSNDASIHFEKMISESIGNNPQSNSYRYVLFVSSTLFFKKSIQEWNLYMNKINFLHYQLVEQENQINYPTSFLWFPIRFLEIFQKSIQKVKSIDLLINDILLNIQSKEINVIENRTYTNVESTCFYQIVTNNVRNGFLLNTVFIPGITYISGASKIIFLDKDSFIFFKKRIQQDIPFQWIGYELQFDEGGKLVENIIFQISFEIKFFHNLPKSKKSGIKIHYPTQIFYDWINECKINEFTKISFKINLLKKSQNILFIFDNELGQVSFEMRNLNIVMIDDD